MSVSVEVKLDSDKQKSWYTNLETLRGEVNVDLRTSVDIKCASISLYGVSTTMLTRVDDFGQKFTDHVNESCVFLILETQLFPPCGQNYGAKYALQTGHHSWPFAFSIPMRTTGPLGNRPLPPSLSDMDRDVASIKYFLRARVDHVSRTALLAIGGPTSVTAAKAIVFLPSDDATIDSIPTYGVFHTDESKVVSSTKTVSGILSRIRTTLAHDKGLTCTGIGQFTVRSDLLITPGLKFSCNIEATPGTGEELVVLGLRISLITRTYIRAKNVDKVVESSVVIFDARDTRLKAGDVTSQLHNPALKLPESTAPSFSFSNLRREYRLSFRVKWTHQPSSAAVHKSYLERKIWIRSGMQLLPNYETGELTSTSREFPQEKWYFST